MAIYGIDASFYQPTVGHITLPAKDEQDAIKKVTELLQEDGAIDVVVERIEFIRTDEEHIEFLKKLN